MKRAPRTSEHTSCTGKVQHESLKRAERANAIMVRKHEAVRGELQPYLCRFCHSWHLGHPRRAAVGAKQTRRQDTSPQHGGVGGADAAIGRISD